MKCTSCGKPVRPVVAVDIDGTLGDYHEHFLEFAEAYVGHKLPGDFRGGMEYSDYLGMDKRVYRDAKLAYRQGGLKRSMPTFPGAIAFMTGLREIRAEIWITTTRPWLRLDNIDPDTREWLSRNGIPYDGLVYDQEKYHQLIGSVEPLRVVLVIEDLLEQCQAAASLDLPVVQPERMHNRDEPWAPSFSTFHELSVSLWTMVDRWKERYADN